MNRLWQSKILRIPKLNPSATLRVKIHYSHRGLWNQRKVVPCFASESRTDAPQAFVTFVTPSKPRCDSPRYLSSTTQTDQGDDRALLQDIETFVDPTDLPKIEQALWELTPSNYPNQLQNLGVYPPDPGFHLDELQKKGRYIDKEWYIRPLVFESTGEDPDYRKSFVSYPRRWGKTVMIQAAAKILRWGGVNESEEQLNEAKQPVLMLDFKGKSIDMLPEYISDEIAKMVKVESLNDSNDMGYSLQKYLTKENAVRAVEALSEILTEKNKKRPLHILIDEYDYPVIHAINPLKEDKYAECMEFYRDFFAATKSVKGAILVTGVSRIGMAGIFSGANHLTDVTFKHGFNGLLGLNWEEILEKYGKALPLIAKRNNLKSIEDLKQKIISWYDGYRFDLSEAGNESPTLFNPFSIYALVRDGDFEPHWSMTGHSSWILTQGICKALLRSKSDSFKLERGDLLSMRIDYKDLNTDDGSSPIITTTPSSNLKRNRLLVALHSGYLTVKEMDVERDYVHLAVPNYEISKTALSLLNRDNARWKHTLDEGLAKDDVRIMMDCVCGSDGFLSFWQEGASMDPDYSYVKVKDISEDWIEKMLFYMFQTANVQNVKGQYKVPKTQSESRPGTDPRIDLIFVGAEYAHVIELKKRKSCALEKGNRRNLEKVKRQMQIYAGSERLKELLEEWNKNALYWIVYFDESHLGENEDIADVAKLKIWVEGPYETDEGGLLQPGGNE